MTGKRRSNIVIDTDSVSEASNSDAMDLEQFDTSSTGRYNFRTSNSSVSIDIVRSRRGRLPSKHPCQNRNALMARKNRQKKKEYVERMERKLSHYREENKHLTSVMEKQVIDLKRLNAEVCYLKNVLNNNTTITSLLRSMNSILTKQKRSKSRSCNEQKPNYADDDASADAAEGIDCDTSTVLDLDPMSSTSSSTMPDTKLDFGSDNVDLGVTDQDIEALAIDHNVFDGNFSDETANCPLLDLISTPVDSENLFENLGNSGICVHVNSGRISLEFCSICHLNSVNSEDL